MNIHEFIETYADELRDYECDFKLPGAIVLHIAPVGDTGYYIGTFTGYDQDGQKSANAIPVFKWMELVKVVDKLLEPFQRTPFTGQLVGYKATGNVKAFLMDKKVHRLFFLEENDVMKFLKAYNNFVRTERKKKYGVSTIVIFGN